MALDSRHHWLADKVPFKLLEVLSTSQNNTDELPNNVTWSCKCLIFGCQIEELAACPLYMKECRNVWDLHI